MQLLGSLVDRSDFYHQLGFGFIVLDDPATRLRNIALRVGYLQERTLAKKLSAVTPFKHCNHKASLL